MPSARDLLSVARKGAWWLARPGPRLTLYALLALIAAWPLLSTAALISEFRDAHVLSHYEQVAVDTVLRHHQLPLWDPFYCGGLYLLGTPQARFVSPSFLLSLLAGEPRGEALAVFAMIIVGLEGAYRYARSRAASPLGALAAAPLFALSGIFASAPSLGWINFFAFELLPWSAYGVRRATRGDRTGIVIAAVSLAWCVGFGGTYAAPMAALWCSFEVAEAVLRRLRKPRRAAMALGMAAAIGLLALGLAAVRLWPILNTLQSAPRVIGGTPSNRLSTVLRMMLFPFHPGSTENADDGAFFLGALALPAVFLGATRWRSLPIVGVTYVGCWLAAGYGLHPPLYAVLRALPVFATLRYPERYLVLVALSVTVLAARGVTLVQATARLRSFAQPDASRRRARVGRILVAVALATLAGNVALLISVHHDFAAQRDMSPAPTKDDSERPFHQARGNRWALAYYEPYNRGSLSCWEAYPVPQSPLLRGDSEEEEYFVGEEGGTATERRWSPNRIDLDVHLSRAARLEVNQNWHPGWHASVGEVVDDHGLLAVDLPAGDHALSLRFLPRSALGGALVSLTAALALLVVGRRRTPPALLAIGALLPMGALAIAAATLHEPAPQPDLTLDDGTPLIAEAPPHGAVLLGTRLEGDVTLEAARMIGDRPLSAGQDTVVELDWRRGAKLRPGLGVFVHLEPSAGEAISFDHLTLSTKLDLEEAPPGRTLRDVFPLHVPDDAKGKQWKMWVGLWAMRGGGERVRVVEAGKAVVQGDRILALEFDVR